MRTHRHWLTALAISTLVALAGCGVGGEEDQSRAAQATCVTTGGLKIRSAPRFSVNGSSTHISSIASGQAIEVTGAAVAGDQYGTDEFATPPNSQSNQWLPVVGNGVAGFVAAAWVNCSTGTEPTIPAGPNTVVYIQVLEDPVFVTKMQQHGAITVIDQAARNRLSATSYENVDQVYREIIVSKLRAVATNPQVRNISLVLQGHSVGRYMFGDIAGAYVSLYANRDAAYDENALTLASIAAELPDLAVKVRHLYLLGCNTAWPANADAWALSFPNIISVNGYAGSAPGDVPAYMFFKESQSLVTTLGSCVPNGQQVIADLKDGSSTSSYTIYQNWAFRLYSTCGDQRQTFYGSRLSIDPYHAYDGYESTKSDYERYLAAAEPGFENPPSNTQALTEDGHHTPRAHYTNLHAFISAVESSGEYTWYDLPALQAELQQAIRLVFFSVVKNRWLYEQSPLQGRSTANTTLLNQWLTKPANLSKIAGAFQEATGLDLPNVTQQSLDSLNRAQTRRFIEGLKRSDRFGTPAASCATSSDHQSCVVFYLEAALLALSRNEIPDTYI